MKEWLYIISVLMLIPIASASFDYLSVGLGDKRYCTLDGCIMEGNINLNGNNITNATFINVEVINASEVYSDGDLYMNDHSILELNHVQFTNKSGVAYEWVGAGGGDWTYMMGAGQSYGLTYGAGIGFDFGSNVFRSGAIGAFIGLENIPIMTWDFGPSVGSANVMGIWTNPAVQLNLSDALLYDPNFKLFSITKSQIQYNNTIYFSQTGYPSLDNTTAIYFQPGILSNEMFASIQGQKSGDLGGGIIITPQVWVNGTLNVTNKTTVKCLEINGSSVCDWKQVNGSSGLPENGTFSYLFGNGSFITDLNVSYSGLAKTNGDNLTGDINMSGNIIRDVQLKNVSRVELNCTGIGCEVRFNTNGGTKKSRIDTNNGDLRIMSSSGTTAIMSYAGGAGSLSELQNIYWKSIRYGGNSYASIGQDDGTLRAIGRGFNSTNHTTVMGNLTIDGTGVNNGGNIIISGCIIYNGGTLGTCT